MLARNQNQISVLQKQKKGGGEGKFRSKRDQGIIPWALELCKIPKLCAPKTELFKWSQNYNWVPVPPISASSANVVSETFRRTVSLLLLYIPQQEMAAISKPPPHACHEPATHAQFNFPVNYTNNNVFSSTNRIS